MIYLNHNGTLQTVRPDGACFQGKSIFLQTVSPNGTKVALYELNICRNIKSFSN